MHSPMHFNGYNVYAEAGHTQTRVLVVVRHSYKLVTQHALIALMTAKRFGWKWWNTEEGRSP
jgi:hypothetical protein